MSVVSIYDYQKRLKKREFSTCLHCHRPFETTGWTTLAYTCNMKTGEHKPLQFVLVGNVLKPA